MWEVCCQKLLEDDPHLGTRERRARADMRPAAESEMLLDFWPIEDERLEDFPIDADRDWLPIAPA